MSDIPSTRGEPGHRQVPDYEQLPISDEGVRLAWGVFGADDEIGTPNLIGPDQVVAGLAEAREGIVHALNSEIDVPNPHPWRRTPTRIQHAGSPLTRDDHIDHLHLQFSTQWDGLRHVGLPTGFYNGVAPTTVDDPASVRLGIDQWARRGIVGRGILLDVAGEAPARVDPTSYRPITVTDLERTAERQEAQIETGDILLVRTGWIDWYGSHGSTDRPPLDRQMGSPGLETSDQLAGWLWNHRISAVATDTIGFEAMPFPADFPSRSLHARLIAGLGMPIGELFSLGELAATCASRQRWTFLFTSAPLNVRGGVGSPANAIAIC